MISFELTGSGIFSPLRLIAAAIVITGPGQAIASCADTCRDGIQNLQLGALW